VEAEKKPRGHARQPVAPVAGWNEPAEHAEHAVMPSVEKVPAAHGVHRVEPAMLEVPAGHWCCAMLPIGQ
jgi:hypothetical protein